MSTLDLGKIKFMWKGAWNASSTYTANDVVAYNSGVWICTQPNGAGTGTEFSPGKRDRANVVTKVIDPDELIVYNITVQTFNSANYFYIDVHSFPTRRSSDLGRASCRERV